MDNNICSYFGRNLKLHLSYIVQLNNKKKKKKVKSGTKKPIYS